jgi:DNA-binding PadR family transcriptional regulator
VAALKVPIIAGARGARKTGVWRRRQNRDSDRMFIGWIARRCFTYNVIYMQPFPYGAILGEFELLVLLALLRLGNGAFGAAIHREIASRTAREISASAVYVTLDRLEAKKMVCSYIGAPTRQRGGRRRKHYLLDTAGQRALVRAWRTLSLMTAGLQPELDDLTLRLSPGATGVRATARRAGW